jgi:CHAT domain-containing protein
LLAVSDCREVKALKALIARWPLPRHSGLPSGQPAAGQRCPAATWCLSHTRPSEAAALSTNGAIVQKLEGEQATYAAFVDGLGEQSVVHLACHGLARPDQPLDSHVLMANDERLTIRGMLVTTRLRGVRVCFLSACDTAVSGQVLPHEVVAMPSAMLQLGSAGVAAAQWLVGDVTAAVLALRFYQLWQPPLAPAGAFAQAQRWLRTATRSEVSAMLRQSYSTVDGIGEMIAELPLRTVPFAAAVDWAAFSYFGG